MTYKRLDAILQKLNKPTIDDITEDALKLADDFCARYNLPSIDDHDTAYKYFVAKKTYDIWQKRLNFENLDPTDIVDLKYLVGEYDFRLQKLIHDNHHNI